MGLLLSRLRNDPYYASYEKRFEKLDLECTRLKAQKDHLQQITSSITGYYTLVSVVLTVLAALHAAWVYQQPAGTFDWDEHLLRTSPVVVLPAVLWLGHEALLAFFKWKADRRVARLARLTEKKRKLIKEVKDLTRYDKVHEFLKKWDPDAVPPSPVPITQPLAVVPLPAVPQVSGPRANSANDLLFRLTGGAAQAAVAAAGGAGKSLLPLLDKVAQNVVGDSPMLVHDIRRLQHQLHAAEGRAHQLAMENNTLKHQNAELRARLEQLDVALPDCVPSVPLLEGPPLPIPLPPVGPEDMPLSELSFSALPTPCPAGLDTPREISSSRSSEELALPARTITVDSGQMATPRLGHSRSVNLDEAAGAYATTANTAAAIASVTAGPPSAHTPTGALVGLPDSDSVDVSASVASDGAKFTDDAAGLSDVSTPEITTDDMPESTPGVLPSDRENTEVLQGTAGSTSQNPNGIALENVAESTSEVVIGDTSDIAAGITPDSPLDETFGNTSLSTAPNISSDTGVLTSAATLEHAAETDAGGTSMSSTGTELEKAPGTEVTSTDVGKVEEVPRTLTAAADMDKVEEVPRTLTAVADMDKVEEDPGTIPPVADMDKGAPENAPAGADEHKVEKVPATALVAAYEDKVEEAAVTAPPHAGMNSLGQRSPDHAVDVSTDIPVDTNVVGAENETEASQGPRGVVCADGAGKRGATGTEDEWTLMEL